MVRRSTVKGAASLRRTLRRLPDTSRDNIADALEASGRRLLAQAKAETPRKSGKLAAALQMKVSRRTLILRIGLITKATQRDLFYGYILDRGRRPKVATIKSGPRRGAKMRIPAISSTRYEFVFGRRKTFKTVELPHVRRAMERALRQAIEGGGDA